MLKIALLCDFLFFMRLFIRFSSHWRTKYADGFAKDGFYIKIRLAHGLATLWSAERIKCRVKYAVGEGLAPPVKRWISDCIRRC